MSFKTVVPITGANTGIGYESVEALLRSHTPHHILLGSQSIAKGEHAVKQSHAGNPSSLSTVEVLCVDISSDYSINSAFEVVKNSHGRVNVLVNSGGQSFDFISPYPSHGRRLADNKIQALLSMATLGRSPRQRYQPAQRSTTCSTPMSRAHIS